MDSRRLVSLDQFGKIVVWDATTGEAVRTAVAFDDGKTVSYDAPGQFLHGRPSMIESEFVYLVERSPGEFDVLRPSQFARLVAGSR